MTASLDDPWEPLGVGRVGRLLAGSGVRWWVAGGRAARVGAAAREHEDTDVVVPFADLARLRAHLADWQFWEAHSGTLRRLGADDELADGREQVWLRRGDAAPWVLDVLLDRWSTDRAWAFKKRPAITVPWARALHRHDGVDYLAPHLALLHKAHLDRPKDRADLAAGVLDPVDRRWLAETLAELGHHEWAALTLDSHP